MSAPSSRQHKEVISMVTDSYTHEISYELPDRRNNIAIGKNGDFLFSAFGCALMERQTDAGMYVYTAVNLLTGKKVILSRRSKKLDKSSFESMAVKISESAIRGEGLFSAEKKPGEQDNKTNLLRTAKHIFENVLPMHGYSLREKQVELADHILNVIERRGITLAEAEVGTGKTHAYLIAAALAKRGRLNDNHLRGHYPNQSWAKAAYMPVVISTSSIALQQAIVSDYIPELSRIMVNHGIIHRPLMAVVRKGKEHYICELRLRRLYNVADDGLKLLLEPFCGKSAPFDLTNSNELSAYIKRAICVSGKCDESCPCLASCRYMQYIKMTNSPAVDFQITNHNYFIADRLHRATGKRPLLPNYQLVIIDEAHKFLQAARQMYGLELTSSELPKLAQDIHDFTISKSNSGVNVHRLAKKLSDQSQKLFRRLNDNTPEMEITDETERFPAVMDSEVWRHLKSINGILADTSEAVLDSRVYSFRKEARARAVSKLAGIGDCTAGLRNQDRNIYWLENRLDGEISGQALCAIPKDLDVRLHQDLWSGGIPIILTSGTLSASGDFTRAKETLGLHHLPERKIYSTTMPSPFDHENNALLYISENIPFPDNKDKQYIAAIASEVEKLIIASHGHAVVLFTSYAVMGQVHSIMKKRNLQYPLFRLERGSTHALERFKKSGNGILLASGALWEGIDIPGDTLSMLIIVKLPFQVPDPIGDYERSLWGDMEIYKARAVVPDMLVKLKQGFGRLLRVESDTGVVAILDSRANKHGAYRSKVLAALPSCRVTSDYKELLDFYFSRKSAAYFR